MFVLQGPDKGSTLKTQDDVILIGRGSDQVPLTDQTVSRRHAELKLADGGRIISDLNSANGTYVNGVRLTKPTRLKYGDQIRVGSTLLVYGGEEAVEHLVGAGIPTDLVTLDVGSESFDPAVMASVPSNEDSVIMAAPDTAYAVKAWKVIRDLSDVIGRLLAPEQMLARVLDIIFEEVEVDRGVVLVRDEQTGELLPEVVRFYRRKSAPQEPAENIVASRTIINHVVASREGVLCSNVAADKRFASTRSVHNLGMRSIICVPILAREQVLGVIHLDCAVTRHTYNEHELRLITAIGYQTGLALENSRLVRQQMEQERLAAAGETVAYLSHYIKNILQGMRSGADVLKRGLDKRDFAVTAQGWQIVEKNLDKSYNLMLNMLAFSKEREPRLELLQLNKIVDEVVELVQRQADEARVILLSELDDSTPPIPLDYDGIHQVVLNLVTNAIDALRRPRPAPAAAGARGDAAPPRSVINVRTRYEPRARRVVLTVTDNGPGVPPELRGLIFEPFHSSKGHGGTGLGLAVARKIVTELGGTIELQSPPDGGAEFVVRLPTQHPRLADSGETQGPGR